MSDYSDFLSDKKHCSGCGACAMSCPREAIKMMPDEKGFSRPVINVERCISCGICTKSCPVKTKAVNINKPIVYAAAAKDRELVMKSSSGGLFGVFAKLFIDNGGAVYGVKMDEEQHVLHSRAATAKELEAFHGSKYVQSDLKNVYKEAENDLKDGKQVLFSGTPCQINGLKGYLKHEYENLYTMDLVCEGVPSPKVYHDYLSSISEKNGKKLTHVTFRDKRSGWQHFRFVARTDTVAVDELFYENRYVYGLLNNIYSRESCSDCLFKGENATSDFTLGDYWGARGALSDEHTDTGISLVILKKERAFQLFEKVKDKVFYEKLEDDNWYKHNLYYDKSNSQDKRTFAFWKLYRKKGITAAMNKYCRLPYRLQMYYSARKRLKKILRRFYD